jgi:hypothetical protein
MSGAPEGKKLVRFSLELALDANIRIAKAEELNELGECNARLVHHAKSFVCAMRRISRVLQEANLSTFPKGVSSVIKYQRKLKKAFLEQYVGPRNAIEHMADEVRDQATDEDVRGFYLNEDRKTFHPVFQDIGIEKGRLMAGGHYADVGQNALKKVLEVRDEIVSAANLHLQRRTPEQIFRSFKYEL